MQHADNTQKASFGHARVARQRLEQLMNDIKWIECGNSKDGYFLQTNVSKQNEANQLMTRINDLFNGFDLEINLDKLSESTIALKIPTNVIKEIAIGNIIWTSNKRPTDITNQTELIIENEMNIIEDFSN